MIVAIGLDGPFDLSLSLEVAASFLPSRDRIPQSLRLAILLADRSTIVEIRQPRGARALEVSTEILAPQAQLKELAFWLTSADLDLRPFYRITARHPLMGPVAKRLHGLKPLRPASLFEMAIIAITGSNSRLPQPFTFVAA